MLSPSDIVDMRLGGGRVVVDSRGILDARFARLGVLAATRVGVAVQTQDSSRAMPDTRVVELDLAPRFHFSDVFAINAAYTVRSFDKSGAEQLLGGGMSFLSPSVSRRGAPHVPVEMRFTHLESISGDAGRPKLSISQLEVRYYYRIIGRGR
jgi:hypothetical protein